jgi:DNA-binding response OmpR family regulator
VARIVIVADDPVLYRVCAWALAEEGHDARLGTLDEASELLTQLPPDLIVVNTGQSAPVKRELLAQFKDLAPGARVVDLAGEGPVVGKTLADGVIRKPLTAEMLTESVRLFLI